MAEYIEKSAAIQNVIWAKENHMDEVEALECTITADVAPVAPVVHGRWEIKTDDYDCEYAKCSACGEEFYDANEDTIDITFNYCPNCGARMDGE